VTAAVKDTCTTPGMPGKFMQSRLPRGGSSTCTYKTGFTTVIGRTPRPSSPAAGHSQVPPRPRLGMAGWHTHRPHQQTMPTQPHNPDLLPTNQKRMPCIHLCNLGQTVTVASCNNGCNFPTSQLGDLHLPQPSPAQPSPESPRSCQSAQIKQKPKCIPSATSDTLWRGRRHASMSSHQANRYATHSR
jgi:hypothetical protein